MIRRRTGHLRSDDAGVAAVEFAILAPILAFVTLGIIDSWSLATSAIAMRAGVSAGANYYIQGGTDDTTAQTLALSAWPNAPDDAGVAVTRACTCSGSSHDCSTLCSGTSKPPSVYVHVSATGTWTGPYTTDFLPVSLALSHEAVVRIR